MRGLRRTRSVAVLAGLAGLLLTGCTDGGTTADTSTTTTATPERGEDVTIYLVRHGETVFNELSMMSGWSDSPLTPDGEAQADAAGVALAGHDFVAAYASDLGRTRQTVEHVLAGQGADAPEVRFMPELREWYFGGFEGTTNLDGWTTTLAEHGYDYDTVMGDVEGFSAEVGGLTAVATMFAEGDPLGLAEDEDAIVERLTAGFEALVEDAKNQGGGDVLVVSHGLSIGTLLEILDPEGYQATSFHNLALSIIEVHGDERTVVSYNDTAYLGEDEVG